MIRTGRLLSHAVVGIFAAASGSFITYIVATDGAPMLAPKAAQAQATGQRVADVLTQPLGDLAREMRVRMTERDPGNGSTAHRHPGHHTSGYILEGTYEVKIGDGPVRQLNAGEAFYEPPGALHAVSRNPSSTQKMRYLIFQVADPTKPATVPE